MTTILVSASARRQDGAHTVAPITAEAGLPVAGSIMADRHATCDWYGLEAAPLDAKLALCNSTWHKAWLQHRGSRIVTGTPFIPKAARSPPALTRPDGISWETKVSIARSTAKPLAIPPRSIFVARS